MINSKPLIAYDTGTPTQSAQKAAKGKARTSNLDFSSFMPPALTQHREAKEGQAPLAAPRVESGSDLRKRPSVRSNTAPVTGRGELSMLPQGPNLTMSSAALTAGGGHSTLSSRPAMAAPDALALQAQGLAQDKVQQSFQGMARSDGSKNLASHSLLNQSSGKGVFSPEVAAQLEARLTGQQESGKSAAEAKPRANSGRALENSPQPLRAVNSLKELKSRTPIAIEHPAARAAKPRKASAGATSPDQTMIGNSPLLAGDSTQALLRAFQDLNIRMQVDHRPSPGMNAGAQPASGQLGFLSARFESGAEGIAAIGYDRHGGTSYGKYQISSRAGTMKGFINYLDRMAPDIARQLKDAGPANTGSRKGKMPGVWRQLAEAQPQRFERLQDDFIRASHLEPAMRSVTQSTGLGFAELSPALQEVVFSTAVQHGPNGAARILNRAMDKVDASKLSDNTARDEKLLADNALIRQIYSLRSTQFGSSTPRVQAAVKSRLKQEMNAALEMLKA